MKLTSHARKLQKILMQLFVNHLPTLPSVQSLLITSMYDWLAPKDMRAQLDDYHVGSEGIWAHIFLRCHSNPGWISLRQRWKKSRILAKKMMHWCQMSGLCKIQQCWRTNWKHLTIRGDPAFTIKTHKWRLCTTHLLPAAQFTCARRALGPDMLYRLDHNARRMYRVDCWTSPKSSTAALACHQMRLYGMMNTQTVVESLWSGWRRAAPPWGRVWCKIYPIRKAGTPSVSRHLVDSQEFCSDDELRRFARRDKDLGYLEK